MNVSNYCPISLLSIYIKKIYEKVMYSHLIAFLDSHLILLILFMLDNLDFVKVIQLAMLLLTSQSVLGNVLTKVSLLAVYLSIYKRPLTLQIIKFYFQNLTIMASEEAVMIGLNHIYLRDSNLSPFVTLILTLGRLVMVSQGFVLGPLLLLIYINDLHLAIKHSETFHFSDDTHLLLLCKNYFINLFQNQC